MRVFSIVLLLLFVGTGCAHSSGENITFLKIPRYGPFIYPSTNNPYTPAISGDGEKVFYFNQPKRDALTEVILLDLKTWEEKQITEGKKPSPGTILGGSVNITVNYDGSKIAFNSLNDYDLTVDNTGELHFNKIFFLDLTNNQIKQISDKSFIGFRPTIDDSGDKILSLYAKSISDTEFIFSYSYFIYDVVKGELKQIGDEELNTYGYALSKDGSKAAFVWKSDRVSENGTPIYEFVLYNTNTEEIEKLEDIVGSPSFSISDMSFDGSYIVLVSRYRQIFIYDVKKREVIQVTKIPDENAWAPIITYDGKRGFFTSNYLSLTPEIHDNENQVYMFDMGKKRIYQLTEHMTMPELDYGIWSSDGISADGKRLLIHRSAKSPYKKVKQKFDATFLLMLTNTREAILNLDSKKQNKDSFSLLIDYDFEDPSFDPMKNDIEIKVGTYTETLRAEEFKGNKKGTKVEYILPKGKSSGIYKMVIDKEEGVIVLKGKNLSLAGTMYTFPVILNSPGLNVDEKLTVEKNKEGKKKLVFKADRKLGEGTTNNVFPEPSSQKASAPSSSQ